MALYQDNSFTGIGSDNGIEKSNKMCVQYMQAC